MRKSDRWYYTLILMAFVVLTLAAVLFINQHFLSDNYISYKQEIMQSVYERLEEFAQSDCSDAAISSELSTLSERFNLNIVIVKGSSAVFSSTRNEQLLIQRLSGYLLLDDDTESEMPEGTALSEEVSEYDLSTRLSIWSSASSSQVTESGLWSFERENLFLSEEYTVMKAYDPVAAAYYLECYGYLSGSYTFIMRTSYQSIEESVAFTNRFYLYTGLLVLAGAIVLLYFVTGYLTRPLRKLTHLAEQMSRLEFAVRYTGKEENEFGVLGRSLNVMSEQLEETISELKTANLKLQGDLEERKRIDKSRDEFISDISHDLKTPIAIISGYAEGLKEGICADAEERNGYCDVIIDEADKMNRLVRRLLLLNQLESGGELPQIEYFDLSELIRGLTISFGRLIENKRGRFVFTEGTCHVWADPGMIEEALSNFLSNALRHVNEGGEIRIFYEYGDKLVRVCVYNSGSQVPEESRDYVWSKFFRLDKARTRSYESNGIGLSIVKAIVERHGHGVGLRNEAKGVTFWLELDLAQEGKGEENSRSHRGHLRGKT